jgi:hypothetical protein
MRTDTTFLAWLRTHQRRRSPLGDLARDVAADGCLAADDPEGIRQHIVYEHGACAAALEALSNARRQWHRWSRAHE